jgi:hypothetical protein
MRREYDEETIERKLREFHAESGGRFKEFASFRCPNCGVRPMLFLDNMDWNDGMPVVECGCLAPFSPRPEYRKMVEQFLAEPDPEVQSSWDLPQQSFWDLPPVRNAEEWALFVQWKLSLPDPPEDDEDGEEEAQSK